MSQKPRVWEALARVARGDVSGVGMFADTPMGLFASMLPLAVLPMIVVAANLLDGRLDRALGNILATICAVLLPSIISHALARAWQREQPWLRYAVAYNWLQFGLSALFMLLLIMGGMFLGMTGTPMASPLVNTIVIVFCTGFVGYSLWVHWLVARNGLAISGLKAALLLLTTYAGTFLLILARLSLMPSQP